LRKQSPPLKSPQPVSSTTGIVTPSLLKNRETTWLGHLFALAFYTIYTLFLLWIPLTHPKTIWGGYDMGHHYPFKFYWIQSLKQGDPAWWNPYHQLGIPFVAHPLVGAFSPFNLIFFLFSPTQSFTVIGLIHFLIAAFGVYYFLRKLGSGWSGAFLAGMAYAFCAFFMAHGYQGQAPLWWAASWIPWSLHFLIRALDEKKLFPLMLSSACLCFCFLEGYPQIVYYTLLLQALYFLRELLYRPSDWKNICLYGILLLVGFLTLAACQVFPTAEFLPLSNRWGWDYSNIMTDYIAPNDLWHFVIPDFRGSPFDNSYVGRWGYHEIVNYIGLIPLVLFMAGIFLWWRVRLYLWFLSVAVLFTIFSLGDSTEFSRGIFHFLYSYLPGFGNNRSVGRMMVITCFAMSCAAGLVLDTWNRIEKNRIENTLSVPVRPHLFGRVPWFQVLILGLVVLDLYSYGHRFVYAEDPALYDSKGQILPEKSAELAIEDPDYPRVAQANLVNANLIYHVRGLFSTDRTDTREMENLYPVMQSAYDSPLSDIIRLKYLYSPYIKPSARWEQIEPCVFRNRQIVPPAFLVGGYQPLLGDENEAYDKIKNGQIDILSTVLLKGNWGNLFPSQPGLAGEAHIASYSNNQIDVECKADRPCLLFLSEQYYPGWEAKVDGKSTTIIRADGAFRAVPILAAGIHHISFSYRPMPLFVGMVVSGLSWGLLFLLGYKKRDLGLNLNYFSNWFSKRNLSIPETEIKNDLKKGLKNKGRTPKLLMKKK
jgi:hypothetical protein